MISQINTLTVNGSDVLVTVPRGLAEKILNGHKRVEFRKAWPTRPVRHVFFCEKASGGIVVARADVCGLEACSPEFAWQRYGAQAGVAADEFFAYCGSRAKINCISLSNVSQMTGICITAFGVKVAPQNYRFLGP